MKLPPQMKKFSIQALDSDRSVYMAGISYSGPITSTQTDEQFLAEKKTCAKCQNDISKTSSRIYRQTDKQTDMAKSTQLVMLIIYIYIFYRLLLQQIKKILYFKPDST